MSGSSSTIKTRSMPDILTPYEENDHFTNVGRVITNPFEMFCDENEFDCARNGSRIFEHVRQQLTKDLFVQIVHDIVVEDNLFGEFRIRIHERIEALFQNLLRSIGHDGKIDEPLELWLVNQFHGAFGNVHSDVADALDVLHDLQRRRYKPQVASDRLFECEHFVAQIVDFDLQPVDLIVPGDYFFGKAGTALYERADRIG